MTVVGISACKRDMGGHYPNGSFHAFCVDNRFHVSFIHISHWCLIDVSCMPYPDASVHQELEESRLRSGLVISTVACSLASVRIFTPRTLEAVIRAATEGGRGGEACSSTYLKAW